MVLRRIRALAAIAGTASLVVAGLMSPAEAAKSHRIYGVVVDQYGNHPDDVFVAAIDEDGDIAASALTYASQQADGPQHGYFFLEVPNGTYTLRFAFGTQGADGYEPATIDDVEVQGAKAAVGSVTVLQERPSSSTSAAAADDVVSTREDVLVKSTVRASRQATGVVALVENGRVLDHAALRKGRAILDAGRLGKGTHSLVVRYAGSDFVKPSASRRITVTVTKRQHR